MHSIGSNTEAPIENGLTQKKLFIKMLLGFAHGSKSNPFLMVVEIMCNFNLLLK